MKKKQKLIGKLLAILFMVGMFPITAFASNVKTQDVGGEGSSENLIVNSSFEKPELKDKYWKYINVDNPEGIGREELGWKTTANDNKIEIFSLKSASVTQGTISNHFPNGVASIPFGNQACELNATGYAGTYQDITIHPKKNYNWGFYHRGRNVSDDEMMVFVIPKSNILSESEFNNAVNNLYSEYSANGSVEKIEKFIVDYDATPLESGYEEKTKDLTANYPNTIMMSDNQDWQYHSGVCSIGNEEDEDSMDVRVICVPIKNGKNFNGQSYVSTGNLVDQFIFSEEQIEEAGTIQVTINYYKKDTKEQIKEPVLEQIFMNSFYNIESHRHEDIINDSKTYTFFSDEYEATGDDSTETVVYSGTSGEQDIVINRYYVSKDDSSEPGDSTKPEDTTKPGDITKPEDSTDSEDIVKPEITIKPSNKGEQIQNNKAPQTGDYNNVLLWSLMFISSLLGNVFLLKRFRTE